MKIYKVKVNGKTYKVELESVDEIKSHNIDNTIEKKVEPTSEEKKKNDKYTVVFSGSGTDILSPIQGLLVDYAVKKGDTVKKGDVLLYIEAMKLKNEVCAPRDGVVGDLIVAKGSNVTAKQLLMKLQ